MRITNIEWLPVSRASEVLRRDAGQICLLYHPGHESKNFLEYTTSNAEYILENAANQGYTEFALIKC